MDKKDRDAMYYVRCREQKKMAMNAAYQSLTAEEKKHLKKEVYATHKEHERFRAKQYHEQNRKRRLKQMRANLARKGKTIFQRNFDDQKLVEEANQAIILEATVDVW